MFLSSMIEIILKFVDVFKFYDRNHSDVSYKGSYNVLLFVNILVIFWLVSK